ncbi:Hsp20/alpha crystallin family protein [Flavobacterium sp. W22_SRS_FP1]|uniref:Hsp20/alpha crystallin family protein n=1 Tax=Flavobacterium sp. W22_SRS_FP1 TaxID=3240276 RepID=UPI003F8FA923
MKNLVKRNAFAPLVTNPFLPSVDAFFDDFGSRDLIDWTNQSLATLGSNLPSVNLKETDKKIEIELAAPGLKKQDFKVEIDNNMLSISSEKEEEKEETRKKDNYYKKEFNYQSFRRSFSLPDYADENKITADYKDGILHVAIDKKEGAQQRIAKTIAIK